MPVEITPDVILTDGECEITYILASGPGGQNVNKVATAAQLRFNAAASPALSERTRRRLLELAGSRATRDGVIVMTGRQHRTQLRNREDVLQRLADLIRKAMERKTHRIPTRPGKRARQRRLDGKSHRAGIKRNRQVRHDD